MTRQREEAPPLFFLCRFLSFLLRIELVERRKPTSSQQPFLFLAFHLQSQSLSLVCRDSGEVVTQQRQRPFPAAFLCVIGFVFRFSRRIEGYPQLDFLGAPFIF